MLNKEKLHLFSFEMQKGVKPSDARLKYLRSHERLLHPNNKCHIIPLNSIFDEPKKSVLLPYLYTDILCKKYNNSIKEDLYGMKKKDKISKIEEKKSKIEEKISKIEEKLIKIEEKLEERNSYNRELEQYLYFI